MIIEIEIKNEDAYSTIVEKIGVNEAAFIIGSICDAVILSKLSSNKNTQKQKVHDVVRVVNSGSPTSFFNHYKLENPDCSMVYTSFNVYLRGMVDNGDVIKIARGQYVYVGAA